MKLKREGGFVSGIDAQSPNRRAASDDHSEDSLDIEAEMDVLAEYNAQEPIQHRFDPYTQNGGSVLGTSHLLFLLLLCSRLRFYMSVFYNLEKGVDCSHCGRGFCCYCGGHSINGRTVWH